jgi:4-aminobutyrate aminotransferase-like enzyme
MTIVNRQSTPSIQHAGEDASNEIRRGVAQLEPAALRTYTPTLAVLARSAGSYHWTPEGRKLADFTSGVLVANLGHNPSRWWRRVIQYMRLEDATSSNSEFVQAAPLTAYNAVTEVEIAACERLTATLQAEPGGSRLEQVMWAASGSEAIQKALWAALKWRPQCSTIIATRYGFHGKKGLAGAVTGCETDPERDPRVHFISFPMDECANLQLRQHPLDLSRYEAELITIARECNGRIACLITEPYLGGGGSYHPQPEYLQLLERFCREHDAIFILDEIQANFGRTGPLFAFTHYGVEPDIVCLGKGLGNGIQVSAAVGRADVMRSLKYGEGSDTWSANPLASAAVLATLDELADGSVLENGARLAAVIEQGLTGLYDTGVVANIRGEGCVWGIECQAVGRLNANEVANACVAACYQGDENGLAIHLLGPLAGKVLRVSPPLTMPVAEAHQYFEVMNKVFRQVAARAA